MGGRLAGACLHVLADCSHGTLVRSGGLAVFAGLAWLAGVRHG